MIIYFADRSMNIIGQASTKLPKGLLISDDTKAEAVDSGVKTYEATLEYDDRASAELMTTPGNYLLRSSDDEAEFYTIIDSTLDSEERSITVYAEDAGLDLLNVVVGPYTASSAMSIEAYTAIYNVGTGFEIGVNEVSTYSRTLELTGEVTATERLLEIASAFDAEISFSFEIDRLSILHKYINYWKKRGKSTGETLRVGEHISNLRITRSAANLATGLYVTGDTPGGANSPITLSGYSYDDGDIYVSGNLLLSRTAIAKWGQVVKRWSYSTTSQAELCTRAVTQLGKASELEVKYEAEVVDLPKGVKVGDTVRIVDNEGQLYLEARILKMETKETTGERKITLGDYVILDSGLNEKMAELTKQVTALSSKTTPIAEVSIETTAIDYDAGTATLKATLYVDGVITTPTSYKWTKGTSTTSIGTGSTLTVSDITASYNCSCTWEG